MLASIFRVIIERQPPRNLAGLPLVLFLFECVDEFDGREEPNALAVMREASGGIC
jgi:hypothetical protein